MNIMVFDVPADTGGGFSILEDYYKEVILYENTHITWYFVVSKPEFQETTNIKILRFPWVKKSWWYRLFFDQFIAAKLVKKYNIDRILSLQNVIIPRIKVPQVLYVHQSLPFVDYKFSFQEDKLLWFYQNILSKTIINSIKKAEKVIVQTKWMKQACSEKSNVDCKKINIVSPRICLDNQNFFKPNETSLSTFFYPAGANSYKNHRIIVNACKRLKEKNIRNYKVLFTLKGTENNHIVTLKTEAKNNNLPIEFIGTLPREEVFKLYANSVLLFPSYIETFGLPLAEARLHEGFILASDCPFSHEILDDYENAHFFDPFDERALTPLIENVINNNLQYKITNIRKQSTIVNQQNITDLVLSN